MFNLSEFGLRLKELMEDKNVKPLDISRAAHTDRSNVSRYLSGENAPQFTKFINLLNYFNCSADFLLGTADFTYEDKTYLPVLPFDKRLREVLKEYGKSQYGLEKETGISGSLVYDWLTGKRLPSLENLYKIVTYLECSADYLLGRVR